VSRFLRGSAVLAVAAGLVMSGATSAFSATPPPITISIAAKSQFKPITGEVLVVFRDGVNSTAQLSGKITGATAGQVVRLLAQPFPFKKPAVRVQSLTVATTGTDPYTFTVKPQIATRYTVELFSDDTATTQLAASSTKPVYLTPGGSVNNPKTCKRPVCTEVFHLRIVLPPSALPRQSRLHWFVYLGLRLSATKVPPPVKTMTLDTKAKVSKSKRVSADTYRVTIKFSFRIANDGFRWVWTACTKDIESTDGIGLPGHHSCGNKRIKNNGAYLG
jgi:hypothetical protein